MSCWSSSCSSSNAALVPDANIVFGGSGANRTVTVTPLADVFGTATITVTVVSQGTPSGVIPKSGWSLRDKDSEEVNRVDRPARYAIDGNPNTFWHSEWYAASPPHPHWRRNKGR